MENQLLMSHSLVSTIWTYSTLKKPKKLQGLPVNSAKLKKLHSSICWTRVHITNSMLNFTVANSNILPANEQQLFHGWEKSLFIIGC